MTAVRRAVVKHIEAVFGTTMTMTDEAELKTLMDSPDPQKEVGI